MESFAQSDDSAEYSREYPSIKSNLSGLAPVEVPFHAGVIRYRVKPGETLSEILMRFCMRPLWGEHGSVKRITDFNADRVKNNGHFVLERTTLLIPRDKLRSDLELVFDQKNEVSALPELGSCKTLAHKKATPPPREVASAPEPVPSPTPAEPVAEPAPGYNEWELTPELSYSKWQGELGSSGIKGAFLSKLNYGLMAQLHYVIAPSFRLSFFGGVQQMTLETASTRMLQSASRLYTSLGVSANFGVSPDLSLLAKLGVEEKPFWRAIDTNTLKFDAVQVPTVTVGGTYTFWRPKPFEFNFTPSSYLLMPVSTETYQISQGLGFRAMIEVVRAQSTSSAARWSSGFFYQSETQNTSITQRKGQEMGLIFRWSPAFGGHEKSEN